MMRYRWRSPRITNNLDGQKKIASAITAAPVGAGLATKSALIAKGALVANVGFTAAGLLPAVIAVIGGIILHQQMIERT